MKKILSSIILIMTVMLICCGCGSEETSEPASDYPENYAFEEQDIKPVSVKRAVTAVSKRDNNRQYNDSQCIKYIDGSIGAISSSNSYEEPSKGFIVTYSFTNKTNSSTYMMIEAGRLEGYQNGVKLPSEEYGKYTEYTEILPGNTIELTKVFETDDYESPVELIAEDLLDKVSYHAVMSTKIKADEKMISTPYTIEIKKAGVTGTGYVIVDHSFTNTSETPVSPGHLYAVQAFQGKESLPIRDQSSGKVGYLKFYKAEPGQTVDLFTTFELKNNEDEVTVYLTVPSTAEIFDKKVFQVK